MKKFLIVLLITLWALVLASENPCILEENSSVRSWAGLRPMFLRSHITRSSHNLESLNRPIWSSLARLSLKERRNAKISIDLGINSTPQAISTAHQIEDLWNNEHFEEALMLFPELVKITDVNEIEIGISWRTPMPTNAHPNDWGNDVRIGNRDSIYRVALDIHRASGNLFAVLVNFDSLDYWWSVNFSSDGGATWNETYAIRSGLAYYYKTISASVLANHCYVAYDFQTVARLRRFRVSDGTVQSFNNGAFYINVFTTTAPDSVKEVCVTSNQDYLDNRLYYLGITKQGDLKLLWSDTGAVSWTNITTNVTNAHRGLDACCNEGFSADRFLWASYIDRSDTLRIDATYPWNRIIKYPAGENALFTSIGAYHDTVICVFEYGGTLAEHCRYLTSYNGGTSWVYGNVGNDTTNHSYCPDVTARDDGGEGIAYLYWRPQEGRYTWRDYYGNWTTPITYADYVPYEWAKPAIEYLGSGFGTAYIGYDTLATANQISDQNWHYGPQTDFRFTRFDGEYFPQNKRVYFLGGRLSNSNTDGTVWCFVPDSGVYHNMGITMPTPISNYTVCLLRDNYSSTDTYGLYIVGGRTQSGVNTAKVQVYYPMSNTTRVVETDSLPMRIGGSIPLPGACIVYNNKLYVFGGFSNTTSPYVTDQTWVYDPMAPAGARWSQITTANLSLARTYISSAVVNGKIYAIGGDIYDGANLRAHTRCEVFDPANPTAGWQIIADLPDSSAETQAFGFNASAPYQFANKIIIAGNGKWPSETNQCFIYDIPSNTWTSFTNLNQARRNHAGVFIPGTAGTNGVPGIWVFGGRVVRDDSVLISSEYYQLQLNPVIVTKAFFDRSDWGVDLSENRIKIGNNPLITLAPNPTRSSAKLSYTVCEQGNVKISLYDAGGRLVKNLLNENKPTGKYTLNIDKQNLSSGIYFILITTSDGSFRKALTIIQ